MTTNHNDMKEKQFGAVSLSGLWFVYGYEYTIAIVTLELSSVKNGCYQGNVFLLSNLSLEQQHGISKTEETIALKYGFLIGLLHEIFSHKCADQ
jgi:hypothetical protein